MFQNLSSKLQQQRGKKLQEELQKCLKGSTLEISRNNICLGKQLQSGFFCSSYKANVSELPEKSSSDVIVKKYKIPKEGSSVQEVLLEMRVRLYIGKHINIINLLGINTLNIQRGKLWMILESYDCDLLSFLRKNHNCYTEEMFHTSVKGQHLLSSATELHTSLTDDVTNVSSNSDFSTKHQEFNRKCLLKWGLQAAMGMNFLASKQVVHGSVCAANLLLTSGFDVKVSGFESPQEINIDNECLRKDEVSLSLKWMAPEILLEKNFSGKSDIWSYGIALWEMFSLGSTPYPGSPVTAEFIKKIRNGLCNEKPKCAKALEYKLMLDCWNLDPLLRPTFSDIVDHLQNVVAEY